jgi:23S rRNA pseudouridine955/2504/2580 synthase
MKARRTQSGPRSLRVSERGDGQRLDNFLLRELKGVPRGLVYRLIRQGAVRVDGRRARAQKRLATGNEVRVPDLERPTPEPTAIPPRVLERLRRAIIHEDDELLVLDKPAGLAVHGGSGLAFGIIEAMRELRPDTELELGHRLDRETSGCLLLAKRRSALQDFHAALREGRVEKRYLALLAGRFASDRAIECDAPIGGGVHEDGRRRMTTDTQGGGDRTRLRAAHSVFRPLEKHAEFQLTEVRIGTGRTHQIRLHAATLGHPVGGDHEYGWPDANRSLRRHGLNRLFLHAQALGYRSGGGETFLFSSPMPDELGAVLHSLDAGKAV